MPVQLTGSAVGTERQLKQSSSHCAYQIPVLLRISGVLHWTWLNPAWIRELPAAVFLVRAPHAEAAVLTLFGLDVLQLNRAQPVEGKQLQHVCPPAVPSLNAVDQIQDFTVLQCCFDPFLWCLAAQLLDACNVDAPATWGSMTGDGVVSEVSDRDAAGGATGCFPVPLLKGPAQKFVSIVGRVSAVKNP